MNSRLGFRIALPGPDWEFLTKKGDLSQQNPNAEMGMQWSGGAFGLLIGESAAGLGLEAYAELVPPSLSDLTRLSQEPAEVNGLPALRIKWEGSTQGLKFRFYQTLVRQEDRVFQILVGCLAAQDTQEVQAAVAAIEGSFRLLDPAAGATRVSEAEAEAFGRTVEAREYDLERVGLTTLSCRVESPVIDLFLEEEGIETPVAVTYVWKAPEQGTFQVQGLPEDREALRTRLLETLDTFFEPLYSAGSDGEDSEEGKTAAVWRYPDGTTVRVETARDPEAKTRWEHSTYTADGTLQEGIVQMQDGTLALAIEVIEKEGRVLPGRLVGRQGPVLFEARFTYAQHGEIWLLDAIETGVLKPDGDPLPLGRPNPATARFLDWQRNPDLPEGLFEPEQAAESAAAAP